MDYAYSWDFAARPYEHIDAYFLRRAWPIPIVLVLLTLLLLLAGPTMLVVVVTSLWLFAVLVYLLIWFMRRRITKRRLGACSSAVFHYRLDEQGFHYQSEAASGQIAWGFRGTIQTGRRLHVLCSQEIGLVPLPVEMPADVLSDLRDRIRG